MNFEIWLIVLRTKPEPANPSVLCLFGRYSGADTQGTEVRSRQHPFSRRAASWGSIDDAGGLPKHKSIVMPCVFNAVSVSLVIQSARLVPSFRASVFRLANWRASLINTPHCNSTHLVFPF